jgi:hypothetical protein
MILMTKEIKELFKKTGRQDGDNPTVIVKYFDPTGSGTWWCTEYDPKDRILYGYVTGFAFNEWGNTSLTELEMTKGGFGLSIERDLWFNPCPIKEALIDYYGEEV